jgi:type IV pilus biogenesis protein PilP
VGNIVMNILTKLNIRQKVMLVLTIIAAAFLTWQIYNFVHGASSPSQPAPAASSSLPATVPPPVVVRQLPASPTMTSSQREYLNLVREYQITKMERQILEEKAGLASAQKRIDETGRNSSALTVGFSSPVYINDDKEYQLAYVDRQAGRWTATLSQGGGFKEVHVGTVLDNGAKVMSITGNSVVLRPVKGKNLVLNFQGSVNVDSDAESGYTVKTKTAVIKQPAAPAAEVTPNNAKIAKILGITTPVNTPPAAVPAPAANKSTKDIPAAPLTVAPAAAPSPTVAPSPSSTPAQVSPTDSQTIPAPAASTSAPASATTAPAPVPNSAPVSNLSAPAPTSPPPASPESSAQAVAPVPNSPAAVSAPSSTSGSSESTPAVPSPPTPVAQPQASAKNPQPKLVSVQELRKNQSVDLQASQSISQASWQQAMDL